MSSPTVKLHGYGRATHATLTAAAYGIVNSNVLSNFFTAMGIDEQHVFSVSFGSSSGSYTGRGWLIEGSILEDTGPLPASAPASGTFPEVRAMFHYFDPVHNAGLSGVVNPNTSLSLSGTTPSYLWGATGVGTTNLCILESCQSFSVTNDFPYASSSTVIGARNHYLNGLTCENLDLYGSPCSAAVRDQEFGLMFRSLGQVLHLLQDAAQPEHVRNDAHLEPGIPVVPNYFSNRSVYENYVDALYANRPIPGEPYGAPSFPLPLDYFSSNGGQGIADITNSGFVSAGTNCTSDQLAPAPCNAVGGYQWPKISGMSGPVTLLNAVYGGNTTQCQSDQEILIGQFPNLCSSDLLADFAQDYVPAGFPPNVGISSLDPYMSTYSLFDNDLKASGHSPVFALNRMIYSQQASFLLPRAVGYSGGLLNFFFRGSMNTQGYTSDFIINNATFNGGMADGMDGTFTLYYDDADGNRHKVPGASWSLSLGGWSRSSDLSFQPPTSPAPAQPWQYILVFQGTMGSETGAVAGAIAYFTPPPATCPPNAVCGRLVGATPTTPVSGILVELASYPYSGLNLSTTSDANGYYSFSPVPPGTYMVGIFPPPTEVPAPGMWEFLDSPGNVVIDTTIFACCGIGG
jgi:hypothetical protein